MTDRELITHVRYKLLQATTIPNDIEELLDRFDRLLNDIDDGKYSSQDEILYLRMDLEEAEEKLFKLETILNG